MHVSGADMVRWHLQLGDLRIVFPFLKRSSKYLGPEGLRVGTRWTGLWRDLGSYPNAAQLGMGQADQLASSPSSFCPILVISTAWNAALRNPPFGDRYDLCMRYDAGVSRVT